MEGARHSRYIRDKFHISYILIFCKNQAGFCQYGRIIIDYGCNLIFQCKILLYNDNCKQNTVFRGGHSNEGKN